MTHIFYFFIQKEIKLPMLWQFFNNFVYTVYTLWIIDELSIGPRGIKMFTNFPILLQPFASPAARLLNCSKSWDIFYIWQKPSVGVYKQIEGQGHFEISKEGA